MLAVVMLMMVTAMAIYCVTQQTLFPLVLAAVLLSVVAVWRIHETGSILLAPLILVIVLVTVLPVAYSLGVSFTNYSSSHVLSQQALKVELLNRLVIRDDQEGFGYDLVTMPDDGLKLRVQNVSADESYLSESFSPSSENDVLSLLEHGPEPGFLPLADESLDHPWLKSIRLRTPEQDVLIYHDGRFYPGQPAYQLQPDGALLETTSGIRYQIDRQRGFYVSDTDRVLTPGFITIVGWSNYVRLFTDPDLALPLLQVLCWSLILASTTVAATFVIGLVLGALINYPGLSFRNLYRTLLVLPVAVPVVISSQMFKGLLGSGYGDINRLLGYLYKQELPWFDDPWLSRALVIVVNIWICYPICFIASEKLLQRLPVAIIEHATLDGVHWYRKWWNLRLPILLRELLPLLSIIFAFSFNNLTLVQLLTDGAPVIFGSNPAVGSTDTLVHWNYHMVFDDDRFNFGLASALASCLFLLMGAWILIHTRLRRSERDIERGMQESINVKAG
ncbi:ABC-type sugar transport system, permease component [Gynuella sunshinyii YC6258]|uniref:Maltose/maltodextrin transport system permease protein n=1 Tax=Gynuella sunshinyii YC6258 TaxID=1445510 RepID=A0A0C5V2Y3_9GAMM|nr:ABC-type sugar transport system, permease component [Gynuella sunshinyii YC6258]